MKSFSTPVQFSDLVRPRARPVGGTLVGSGQGFRWSAGSGASVQFANGDNNTKYHVILDFTQPLLDKLGAVVPMSDCRKMYMVFAPRFENAEQDLQDGCFLTPGVGTSDSTWTVDDTSKLTGGRYFIGTPTAEERVLLVAVDSPTQITVERGYQSSTPATWPAGTRAKKLSPISGFASDAEWGATVSNITVTGDRALKVGGARRASKNPMAGASTTAFGRTTSTLADSRLSGGAQATRNEQHPTTRSTFARSGSRTRSRRRTIFISGPSCTPTAGKSAYRWTARQPRTIFTSRSSAGLVDGGTLTTAWQRFKITGTLAGGQTGLWIVVRQYDSNGDDWSTGSIYLWGACLQQGTTRRSGTRGRGHRKPRTWPPELLAALL